ncbi:MAG: acyl-CoA dehydratase activase, partial [Myxococcota bacterium]|nr:acyl-CoA dehydratase activase [Myxococcota bacterium]
MQHRIERAIGLSLGAASIKLAMLESQEGVTRVVHTEVHPHAGDPRRVLQQIVEKLDHSRFDFGLVTGRKLRNAVLCASVAEPEAHEAGLRLLASAAEPPSALASLGAESFVVYRLSGNGHIDSVETGSKCASGTGEFFLQQVGRMNVGVDEAIALATGVEPYRVSGRCTVFCKSDCTHALNKGVPVGRVAAGLAQMTTDKVVELLDGLEKGRVAVVGGMTGNRVVMELLGKQVAHLQIPEHAEAFEAVGAAALALERRQPWSLDPQHLFVDQHASFDFLPPLRSAAPLVRFEAAHRGVARPDDECIVGLDVGSTTTKAVLLRRSDDAVLASIYLRTHGNPVEASRQCYASLASALECPVRIVAVATTGSGRQIAGLHAGTQGVINEIIAHATGAAYYDPEVDTIFEIGGQDAKYTHLLAGVPADYAMNEACSAGTGSFLEEAARESMGLDYREIAEVAVAATRPPNFNDQCAAFISSDIKTAIHEGIGHSDAVAGLVYSICMNYLNRVKGARAVGKKVFMQGGVCYNRAVPLAMASLLEKEIIVPPDPGLIGAFGVALEAKHRMESGALLESSFNLDELATRTVEQGKPFHCRGGKGNCDRACEIATMIIEGRKYPFGGACNKYYNELHRVQYDPAEHDYVRRRQDLVFETHAAQPPARPKARIGVLRTFLTNRYYPLYSHFFAQLGLEPVLSKKVDEAGMRRSAAEMCYPAEIAHGALANLLSLDVDYLFLPKLFSLPVEGGNTDRKFQASCLLLQSEAYWLRSAFAKELAGKKLIEPQFDFNEGIRARRGQFATLAAQMGASWFEGSAAFGHAVEAQEACETDIKDLGQQALRALQRDPSQRAVVLFGRAYSAFAKEANLAIPTKLASRGVTVIPWDALPFESEPIDPDINWAIGQNLLRAGRVVARHPQLFGTWITNFSCGPDSFLVGYFRDIMGRKPSLTLELDSHSADAGVNTRIEAFLDIVDKYRRLKSEPAIESSFVPARIILRDKKALYESSSRALVPLTDPSVHLIFPNMGPLSTEILAGVFRGIGVKATALPVPDHEVLRLGRGNTSCKECLPLQLVTGALLKYLK